MKARIDIAMDNAAFEPSPSGELSRILFGLSKRVAAEGAALAVDKMKLPIVDSNGNKVGKLTIRMEKDAEA